MEPVVKLCKASMRQKPASVSLRGLGIFCIGDCVSNDCRQNSNPREKEDQMHQHDSVSRRKHSPQRMDLSMRFGFRCFQSDLRAKIKWQDFRTFQPVTESKCIHSTTVLHWRCQDTVQLHPFHIIFISPGISPASPPVAMPKSAVRVANRRVEYHLEAKAPQPCGWDRRRTRSNPVNSFCVFQLGIKLTSNCIL